MEDDTRRGLDALEGVGVRPTRWRAPRGVEAPWTAAVAADHGLELCGWDVDSHDWRGDRAEAMLADIGPELHEGAVVLLHDGLGPCSRRYACLETVRLVRLLAGEAAASVAPAAYSYS